MTLDDKNGSAVKTGQSLRVRWSGVREQDGPRRRPRAERGGELCSYREEGDGPRQEGSPLSPAPKPPPRRRGQKAGPVK